MNTYAVKTPLKQEHSAANSTIRRIDQSKSSLQLNDGRPASAEQAQLQMMAANSPQVQQWKTVQKLANDGAQSNRTTGTLTGKGWVQRGGYGEHSAPNFDSAGTSTVNTVTQLKWGWWKNRRTQEMTFYDNSRYPKIHVSWNIIDTNRSHVTYDHTDGSKSFYYPFTHSFTYDDTDERCFVKGWLCDAWDDFKSEFNV